MDSDFKPLKVVHSESKNEWLIICTKTASSFVKIPYWYKETTEFNKKIGEINKRRAKEKADFLCNCMKNKILINDYLQEIDNFINENK